MTINVALATYDGIILGCDSLSSVVEPAIFPFKAGCDYVRGEDGEIVFGKDGAPMVSLGSAPFTQVATTVFGGVKKMFEIYADEDTCVAAVTAGLATLKDVTIAEQAKRFRRRNDIENTKFTSVDDVAGSFHAFMRDLWERNFEGVPDDQRSYMPTIQFIVAGFGVNDEYGKVFKLDIAANSIDEEFPTGDHMGICWAGQADQVERLVLGFDSRLQAAVLREVVDSLNEQREETVKQLGEALGDAGVVLPEDLELNVTEPSTLSMPWASAQANIDYGNLSTQYAVDLVELLVNTQSGMQRFAVGIPTVGGRTHIGVLKRGERFTLLNEPTLHHRHTGYSDEY